MFMQLDNAVIRWLRLRSAIVAIDVVRRSIFESRPPEVVNLSDQAFSSLENVLVRHGE